MKKYSVLSLLLISSLMSTLHGGNTPLMQAISEGNIPKVNQLLKTGANPNERNSAGRTPLYFALRPGKPLTLTKLLLQYKADLNALVATDLGDLNSLSLATLFGTEEQVKLLLEHGADPFKIMSDINPRSKHKKIKLIQAAQTKQPITTLLLCMKNIDPNLIIPGEIIDEITIALFETTKKDIVQPKTHKDKKDIPIRTKIYNILNIFNKQNQENK